jgi:hypothetical protein
MSDADKKPKLAEPATEEGEAALPEMDAEMEAALREGVGAEAAGDEAGLDEAGGDEPSLDEADMRDLLRSALAPPPGAVAPSLLLGVQGKLRRRSRGKFYGDGWSTARAPRSTYLYTSVLMLVMIGLVFLLLIPWDSGALP